MAQHLSRCFEDALAVLVGRFLALAQRVGSGTLSTEFVGRHWSITNLILV
jgi:hypothetical protein